VILTLRLSVVLLILMYSTNSFAGEIDSIAKNANIDLILVRDTVMSCDNSSRIIASKSKLTTGNLFKDNKDYKILNASKVRSDNDSLELFLILKTNAGESYSSFCLESKNIKSVTIIKDSHTYSSSDTKFDPKLFQNILILIAACAVISVLFVYSITPPK
jgi:hypothetical protein